MNKIFRICRTIKYLTPGQIFYRLFYTFKTQFSPASACKFVNGKSSNQLSLYNTKFAFLPSANTYKTPASFTFLNLTHDFPGGIDWNFIGYGKLWTYNLNYFDYLLQSGIKTEEGLQLMHRYLNKLSKVKYGLEPYPVSLRIINWVKFCFQHKTTDVRIDKAIHGHTSHLSNNLEYHLLANHLLENAFALCIGGLYTGDEALLSKGQRLLNKELKEQILPDGSHYERSPMYHQIILGRLLDLIQIADALASKKKWTGSLRIFAGMMLGWITQVSFQDTHLPLFNDAAFNVAHSTNQLIKYAQQLDVEVTPMPLKESGFRKITGNEWELLFDSGNITPSYQPGHAHADTFSFELYYKGSSIIVDTGTSTYEPGERRSLERATKSHNTVELFNTDSSEVWASHRVGRRANVTLVEDSPNRINAWHNGYKHKGAIHRRSFSFHPDSIDINDFIIWQKNKKKITAFAYLHFSPGIGLEIRRNELYTSNGVIIIFSGNHKTEILEYKYASEFNKLIPALAVKIEFIENLNTLISFETTFSHR